MSPELEAALDPIGWQRIKARAPSEAKELALQLTKRGGRFGQTPAESAKKLKEAAKALKSLHEFYEWSLKLNHDERAFLSPEYAIVGDDTFECPEMLGELQETIFTVHPRLNNFMRYLSYEARGVGKKNLAARSVADALVRIHVMGTGERAKPSRDVFEEPNNAFSEVACNVFKILGVGRSWYRRCLVARNALSEEEFDRLKWATSPCPVRGIQREMRLRDFFSP